MVWKGDAHNRLAKCLIKLIDEVNTKFPGRDKHNDGSIGDAAHQQTNSDHNPHVHHQGLGVVTALDVTDDPASGFSACAFAEALRGKKDPRIKYVIFDGRIFSSTELPWKWRDRNKGPGDHSEHVHVSVVADPNRFDDDSEWPLDNLPAPSGKASGSRPKLKLGSQGADVLDLQHLLGIKATGVFEAETDQAVRAFQASRNLFVDGVVGSHTWATLMASTGKLVQHGDRVGLPASAIEQIANVAAHSALIGVDWGPDRGVAPRGFIKGMAVTFGQVYAKWKAGDSATRLMAAVNSGNEARDALAWYNEQFLAAGMENSTSGASTLRHLFVLLIGLGIRESSGRYWVGRDTTASNVSADTAEAGLFQMSWNARHASSELPKLFAAYSVRPEGFLSIFQEGVPAPDASALENVGTGEGVAFQQLCKSCPAFAAEAAAVGLRVLRKHWGPINRREAQIHREADQLLQQVQGIVDAIPVVITQEETGPEQVPSRRPPLASNAALLILMLLLLAKEKPMGTDPAKPGEGLDHLGLLLPLVLQCVVSGKRIDASELLTVLLTGKSLAPTAPAPVPIPSPQPQPSRQAPGDLITALLPVLLERLTGKPVTPAEPPKKPDKPEIITQPATSRPSVQLSAGGLAISTLLQALGLVGTPFGLGPTPTQAGTLATLIPIITGAVGMTGGWGALLNVGRLVLGGIASAAHRPK